MTAYLLTPEKHAQIVDALEWPTPGTSAQVQRKTALAMLKAMKPVEPVGYTDSRGRFFYKNDPHMIQDHSGMPELYALGDTA